MLRHLAAFVALGCMSACGVIEQMNGRPAPEPAAAAPAAVGLGVYLDALVVLVQDDPVAQADAWQRIEQAAATSPTTTNRLRLALARAVPGHPGSDPVQAHGELGELLAFTDALLPEERALATVQLHELEQRLVLEEQTRQLRETADQAAASEREGMQRRLDAARAENLRLQQALEDASQKLDAITSIERSIREREDDSGSP